MLKFFSNREGQIILPFPKESPLSSHMSRQAMFPKAEQILSPTPTPVILNKAMGSFGRREIIMPVVNSRTATPPKHQVRPVQVYVLVGPCHNLVNI